MFHDKQIYNSRRKENNENSNVPDFTQMLNNFSMDELIEYMDEKTQTLMNEDDIQLTLYVSRKPGAGSRLLNELCVRLKKSGYKNLFLWTDIECNWEWYINHGYELVEEGTYEQFSSDDEDYKTFIFRKAL